MKINTNFSTIKDKPQYIACYKEIEDLLDFQDYLENYDLNLAFNSNNAGSSINVWHTHIVKFNVNSYKNFLKITDKNSDLYIKEIDSIATSHKVFLSKYKKVVSQFAFKYIDILNSNNNPYNLVFFKNKENYYGIIIFIRGNWQENVVLCQTPLDHSPGYAECLGDLILLKKESYNLLKDLNLTDKILFKKLISCWQKAAGQGEDKIKFFDSLFYK